MDMPVLPATLHDIPELVALDKQCFHGRGFPKKDGQRKLILLTVEYVPMQENRLNT
jgi:hypothetical protein